MKLRQLLCGFTLLLSVGAQTTELRAQFGGFGALFGRNQAEESDRSHNHNHHHSRGSNQQAANQREMPAVSASQLPDMDELKARIERVLDDYYSRPLNTRDNDSWEVMHSIIAYGVKSEVAVGGPQGERRNAIGWLCYNLPLRGPRMLTIRNDLPYAVRGVSVQGHYGQFLAILAQSRLSRTYPLLIDGRKFTIEDLIESEKRTCTSGEELTFKLIALAHYLPTDAQWVCERGQKWDIPRLIREEIRQPITHSAACGGTHRLMGLAYAVRRREQQGKPIDGDFALARDYLQQYFEWTFSLQNPDGSFSTAWLARRENRPDIDRKIQCTGHITEWLVYALPKHELHNPQVIAAVNFLATSLEQGRDRDWKIGPLGHALHALAIYKERMFDGKEDRLPDDAASGSDAVASSKVSDKDGHTAVDSADVATSKVKDTPRARQAEQPRSDSAVASSRRPQAESQPEASDEESSALAVQSLPEKDTADESPAVVTSPAKLPALDAVGARQPLAAKPAPVADDPAVSAPDSEPADEVIPEYRPLTVNEPTLGPSSMPALTPVDEPVSEPASSRLRIRVEAGPALDAMPAMQSELIDDTPTPELQPVDEPLPPANESLDAELFRLIHPGADEAVPKMPASPNEAMPGSLLDDDQVEGIGPAAGGSSSLLLRRFGEPKLGRQLPAQRERPPVHVGRRPQAAEGPMLIGPR